MKTVFLLCALYDETYVVIGKFPSHEAAYKELLPLLPDRHGKHSAADAFFIEEWSDKEKLNVHRYDN